MAVAQLSEQFLPTLENTSSKKFIRNFCEHVVLLHVDKRHHDYGQIYFV